MDESQEVKIGWGVAPDWAQFHVFQSWGEGMWGDQEPTLGAFFHNRGRWNFVPGSKSRQSGYSLPLGMDYRVTLVRRPEALKRPTIVVLCGSTRFSEAYQKANLQETVAGRIVLTIGCDLRSDKELFEGKSQEELIALKQRLDDLHLWKVSLADEVLILNVNSYVGESTARELEYARELGKVIRFLEPESEVVA